ncbi:MAG: hypothetical protein AAFQ82_22845, partial [Myxococcota bacterium]
MAVLRELASKELGKPVSNRELVELEARRSGELAARLQHFKIAHGALTSGNILALPALIDLNTVRTMPVPDPNYSPFGRRFRYGEQPTALRKLVDERAKIYANHDPSVKGADIKGEFQKAFDKELAITTATRLGMTREKAELLYFARSEKLEPLSKEFWSLSMGYLKTDVEGMFRDMVAAQLQGGEFDVRAARSGYARDKSDIPDGYRANLQRASNAVTLRYSEAPVAGLERLQAKLAELLPAAVLVASEHKKELREVTKSEMVERAGLVANPQLPSVEQVDGLAAKVEEAVQRGEDVGPIVRQLDALLNPARMAMGKALPAANALITDTPATTKVETDYNAWVEAEANAVTPPPNFDIPGGTAVYAKIQSRDTEFTFDARRGRILARSTVVFDQKDTGFPVMDLVPDPTKVLINGEKVSNRSYARINEPGKMNKTRVLKQELEPGKHTMQVEYELPTSRFAGFDSKGGGRLFLYSTDRTVWPNPVKS